MSKTPDPPTAHAGYATTCQSCSQPIEVGDLVARSFRAWVHEECYTTAQATYLPGAERSARGYAVACPRCGAEPDQACVTESGKKSPVHAARRDSAPS